jgi:hypothetical protein
MGLYDNIAENLGRLATTGKSAAENVAMGLVNKYAPIQVQRAVNVGMDAVGDLMRGGLESAGMRLLDCGLLPGIGWMTAQIASQIQYWNTPTPLFGGITPTDAKRIYEEMREHDLAKKNLWLIDVSSKLNSGAYNMPDRFNMFATEVEYEPFIVAGDKHKVGGAVVDAVQGKEPVELRLTTLDDKDGNLKQWFALHHKAAAAPDGTVGVPGSYAIKIKVAHAVIVMEHKAWEFAGLFRPVNIATSLSRREDGLEEIQMTFSELDTFMAP